MIFRIATIFCALATAAEAEPLNLPSNAALAFEEIQPDSTLLLPTGTWDGAAVPARALDGTITRQSYHVAAEGLSSQQILRPLIDQLRDAGYEIKLDCQTRDCGGFDFRFGIEVLPPPDMFVNLAQFQHISALRRRDDGTEEAFALLASVSSGTGFLQVFHVGPEAQEITRSDATRLRTPAPDGDLANSLLDQGRAVLAGISFDIGSARLTEGDETSLRDLAAFLEENADLRIALVGHTDAEGALESNIALSRRRAAAVLERLATDYGVSRARMDAEGMGYLAPIASNLTEAGREANRRVEVIITSTN